LGEIVEVGATVGTTVSVGINGWDDDPVQAARMDMHRTIAAMLFRRTVFKVLPSSMHILSCKQTIRNALIHYRWAV
jgi:hypothetical protein